MCFIKHTPSFDLCSHSLSFLWARRGRWGVSCAIVRVCSCGGVLSNLQGIVPIVHITQGIVHLYHTRSSSNCAHHAGVAMVVFTDTVAPKLFVQVIPRQCCFKFPSNISQFIHNVYGRSNPLDETLRTVRSNSSLHFCPCLSSQMFTHITLHSYDLTLSQCLLYPCTFYFKTF